MRIPMGQPGAIAQVRGSGITGTVKFYQMPGGVLVVAEAWGLPKENPAGFFAFHIHQGADCAGPDFSDTGSHFNPTGQLHPRHAGDLPPLLSNNGRAFLAVLTDRFSLSDIRGRTVVIHSGPDDFHTQPAGNAGTKIACGIIR